MRAVTRLVLPASATTYLATRTTRLAAAGNTKTESDKAWKSARRTKKIRLAVATLVTMNAGSERCMYCEHDRATDIDHHCPRSHSPALTFAWSNWLLACTVCNSNYKRNQYPAGLLDPSATGYSFDTHFEIERHTGAFTLKTPQAMASEPVFGLNDGALQQSRKHVLAFLQATIVLYADAVDAGDAQEAARSESAVRSGLHPSVLATIQRWHGGSGRPLLHPMCADAIDRHPVVLSW